MIIFDKMHNRIYDKRMLEGKTLKIHVESHSINYGEYHIETTMIFGEDVETHETYILDEAHIRSDYDGSK